MNVGMSIAISANTVPVKRDKKIYIFKLNFVSIAKIPAGAAKTKSIARYSIFFRLTVRMITQWRSEAT